MGMLVILYEPQIPQNTGNVVRTCANVGAALKLVNPGFSLSDRKLKRAGLDYWENVDVERLELLETFLETNKAPFYFFSSHTKQIYTEIEVSSDDVYIFGSETDGLPKIFRETWPDRFYALPKKPNARCLNLASTVAALLYHSWGKQGFR